MTTIQTCQRNHVAIQHDEFYCPLCAAEEDTYAESDRVYALEKEFEDFKDKVNGIVVAEVVDENAALETRVYQLRTTLNTVEWRIRRLVERSHTKAQIDSQLRELHGQVSKTLKEEKESECCVSNVASVTDA